MHDTSSPQPTARFPCDLSYNDRNQNARKPTSSVEPTSALRCGDSISAIARSELVPDEDSGGAERGDGERAPARTLDRGFLPNRFRHDWATAEPVMQPHSYSGSRFIYRHGRTSMRPTRRRKRGPPTACARIAPRGINSQVRPSSFRGGY